MPETPINPIISTCNMIAELHKKLAAQYEALGCTLANGVPPVKAVGEHLAANPNAITAEQVDAMKSPEVAKADKADAKKDEPKKDDVLIAKDPGLTPEAIAADIKAKLVALVNKQRAKAVAILGSVGAKNFSTIPVDKHPEVLLALTAALTACDDNDPLT